MGKTQEKKLSTKLPEKKLIGKTKKLIGKTKKPRKSRGIRETSKTALFLKLAKPDKNGVTRWVSANEWTDDYSALSLGNGLSWGRKGSTLESLFVIEKDRTKTKGNSIDAIRLNGIRDTLSL